MTYDIVHARVSELFPRRSRKMQDKESPDVALLQNQITERYGLLIGSVKNLSHFLSGGGALG